MPRLVLMLLCLAAPAAGLSACGGIKHDEQGREEPAREGVAIEFEGIDYNVFITRQLNTRIPPDEAYVEEGTLPDEGELLYGVFLQACNNSDEAHETVDEFKIVDNQGNEFEPEEIPETNEFAYHPRELLPDECIPEIGGVAQLGPSAGSMLLFRLPLENTEYRPLELEVFGEGEERITFELDI